MKLLQKLFLLFALTLISCIMHAQIRLGSTRAELMKEYPKLKSGTNAGFYFLFYETDDYTWIFTFGEKEKTCEMNMVKPKNGNVLSGMIEKYNNNCVRVSDTNWTLYDKGKVIDVMLMYSDEEDQYYFLYKFK